MQAPFLLVVDILEHGQRAGDPPARGISQATACWAHLHGLTMLAIDGRLVQKVGDHAIEDALTTLLDGLVLPVSPRGQRDEKALTFNFA